MKKELEQFINAGFKGSNGQDITGAVIAIDGGFLVKVKEHPAKLSSTGKTMVIGSHGEKLVSGGKIATCRINVTIPV